MGIFDFLRKKRPAPTSVEGVGGTAAYGGFLVSPEQNQALIGRQRYLTFAQVMLNTSIVGASVRYYLNLCARASWKVEPAEDGGSEGERLAEVVDDAIFNMTTPWFRVVRRAAMYRFHGFSIQEWMMKKAEDGTFTLADLEPRPQQTIERWDIDETGTLYGVVQRAPQDGVEHYLNRSKLVYLVDDALTDSPDGIGLLRHIVEPARRLGIFETWEGIGFQTDLRGVPVVRAPLGNLDALVAGGKMTAAQRELYLTPLRNFVNNHNSGPQRGLLIDSLAYASQDAAGTPSTQKQFDVELLTAGATSQEAIAAAITRIQVEIARVLGTESLLLGADGKGSLALSKDKSAALAVTVDGTLTELAEQFRRDLIVPLARVNGWDEKLMPKLVPDATQLRDVDAIATALEAMARAGATLQVGDPAIDEVRRLLGLSRAPEVDLEMMQAIAQASTYNEPDPAKGEEDVPLDDEGDAKADPTTPKGKDTGAGKAAGKVKAPTPKKGK